MPGFTLVELLVAMAILAAALLPASSLVVGNTHQVRVSARRLDGTLWLESVLDRYRAFSARQLAALFPDAGWRSVDLSRDPLLAVPVDLARPLDEDESDAVAKRNADSSLELRFVPTADGREGELIARLSGTAPGSPTFTAAEWISWKNQRDEGR